MGRTAASDLMLNLIGQAHGKDVAIAVAELSDISAESCNSGLCAAVNSHAVCECAKVVKQRSRLNGKRFPKTLSAFRLLPAALWDMASP